MLKFIFTFDHIMYARYNSFQQAFGVIATKPTDLHEAFSYPTTSLPVSIASPNSSLYQSEKAGFRNIMKSSNSVSSSFPQNTKQIIDGMVAMRSLKPRSTYMEYFIDLLKYLTLRANINTHSLDIKMNMNMPRSVKEETRTQRSTNPGPKDGWKCFFSNSDNKNNLIALFAIFLHHQKVENTTSIFLGMLLFIFTITNVRLLKPQKFQLSPLASLKIVNTYVRVLISSKVKVKNCTLLKNNIAPQVHFAFCNEAGGLESRKTFQIIFFKKTLKSMPFKKC